MYDAVPDMTRRHFEEALRYARKSVTNYVINLIKLLIIFIHDINNIYIINYFIKL